MRKLKEIKRNKMKDVKEEPLRIDEYDIDQFLEYDEDGIEKTEVEHSRSLGRLTRFLEAGNELPANETLLFPEYGSVRITERGDILGTYEELQDFLADRELQSVPGKKASVHIHHLVHQAALSELGIPTDTCPSVVLDEYDHLNTVHAFDIMPDLTGIKNANELKQHYRDIYTNLEVPEWANLSDQFLDEHSEIVNSQLALKESINPVDKLEVDASE